MKYTYDTTLRACYLGYVNLAIIIFFPPLLFVTFHESFNISLFLVGLLVTINFIVQTLTDLVAARFVDRVGYRICAVLAHVFCALGLILMGILPFIMDPYTGLLIATVITAIGGGLIEVLISPIVEALPGEKKSQRMSMLHSFLCWGQVAIILIATLYFMTIGIDKWYFLAIILAIIPIYNAFIFTKTPIKPLVEKGEGMPISKLLKTRGFWLLFVLMLASGAAEMATAQWASFFAEAGLNISKTVGDLIGSCMFGLLMGIGRVLYAKKGGNINLITLLIYSSVLCIISYIMIVFSPSAILSLLGFAISGLAVSILWPGLFSVASEKYPIGGTAMFAFLAFAGDIGCSLGPGVVGFVSDFIEKSSITSLPYWVISGNLSEYGLKLGILIAIVFPIAVLIGNIGLKKIRA